ncbi:hypothetical protein MEBOL_001736 [Melittangium boletus DSM 14713]|uniref:Uncharacterized protein n=1 Tax=Melittangium boletus DSM 14713 TaxID=1294270 RepID=A0A250IAR0_9BACT|nr:hypothetical protein MEBOL_001736 [Melittangium boletus DSM 14713]
MSVTVAGICIAARLPCDLQWMPSTMFIYLPVDVFGHQTGLCFADDHPEWEGLHPSLYQGEHLYVPDDQFCDAAIVPDVTLQYDGRTFVSTEHPPDRRGIVLLLESPHRDEYEHQTRRQGRIGTFRPREPLWGKRANLSFLPDLLACIQNMRRAVVPALTEVPLTLCNPVPLQTSLHRLYASRRDGLKAHIRTVVWKQLFGLRVIEQNFGIRLRRYRPLLILDGCTKPLSDQLMQTFTNLGLTRHKIVKVRHPSYWDAIDDLIDEQRRMMARGER